MGRWSPWTAALSVVVLCGVIVTPKGEARARGESWRYLTDKLVSDGADPARVRATFADRRVPAFSGLGFSIKPREPSSMYRKFRTSRSVGNARGCRDRLVRELRWAQGEFGVPANLITAILHIETHCGRNTGKSLVLHRLARLAMAAEPKNVERNVKRHTKGLAGKRRQEVEVEVRQRARVLEEMFYPEVLATFQLAARLDIDPLGIRGSSSGAFGYPQFLPSSYLNFAVDGNGDGEVSLYDSADAVASVANYLVAHGWQSNLSRSELERVIWSYNHSDSYIDAVLYLADRIR